jgi:hypothetical protein
MIKNVYARAFFGLAFLMTTASSATAQGMFPGRFLMEWVDVTRPVSSNSPDLTYGNTTVDLLDSGVECPPSSRYSIQNPMGFGSATWCFGPDGGLDGSAAQYIGGTVWHGPNGTGGFDVFQFEMEHGSRACCTVHAVGRRMAATPPPPTTTPPPPTTGLKAAVTYPKAGATISGFNWPTAWCDVCSGTSVFSVHVDGVERGRMTTTSKGPVSIRWDTHAVSNNANHTITVKVTNGTKTGTSAGVTVRVANP